MNAPTKTMETAVAANAKPTPERDEAGKKLVETWERQRAAIDAGQKAPYGARELQTSVGLLALQIDELVRDFQKKTGMKSVYVNTDYAGRVKVSGECDQFGRLAS